MKWQEGTKRWIIKVRKTLRRQKWRERVVSCGGKDPLVCPHCENYYEYKGEVCLENGKLIIKVALTRQAEKYLERMIAYLTNIETPHKEKKTKERNGSLTQKENERQLCLFGVS